VAAYNKTGKFISYVDIENNVWHYENGQMDYVKTLNFPSNQLFDYSPTKLLLVSK